MKTKILTKDEINDYIDDIDKIHLENAYPNDYLIDDDYIINADKIFLVFMDNIVVGYINYCFIMCRSIRMTTMFFKMIITHIRN